MLKIKEIECSKLKPYDNNARINDHAVDAVANSIKEFGMKNPIIIDKDFIIIAGHTRLKALQKLGIEKAPCIIADDLTEDQIKAFRIADNSTGQLAEWDLLKLQKELDSIDMDMLQFGLAEQYTELEELRRRNQEIKEDDFDVESELPKEPEAKLGDIYELGNHRLMCGDSTKEEDVSRLMAGEQADLVFTDPPYGVSYTGNHKTDGKEWEMIENDDLRGNELYEFLLASFKNIKRFLKLGGAFYIWYANSNSIAFEKALMNAGLKKKQILIWQKGMVLGRSDYHWTYEPCLYGCHEEENCKWYGDRCQVTFWNLKKKQIENLKKEEAIELLLKLQAGGDVWEIKRDNVMSYIHPTQKPVGLAAKAMKNSSKEGMTVLDLFGGSGSTLMAAEQLKQKGRIMEYDPKYVDAIIKRWEQFTGGKAKKL